MFYNSKEGIIKIGKSDMNYVAFGSGEQTLVIIPGLSDGLKTVKGTAFAMARYYRIFAKQFRVYIFSRINDLTKGYTTRDMARDQKEAMDKLKLENAYVMGISQGGMISQYIAIDYPSKVKKFVIGVSVSRQNNTVQQVVKQWIDMADNNNYKKLTIDTMEKTFTEKHVKKYRLFYPILTKIGRPKSFERFLVQADACITHNAYDELEKIKCPTLVIGGDSDKVVGDNTSQEMAEKIKNSKLIIYEGLGHGAFEETKDFNKQVLEFFVK